MSTRFTSPGWVDLSWPLLVPCTVALESPQSKTTHWIKECEKQQPGSPTQPCLEKKTLSSPCPGGYSLLRLQQIKKVQDHLDNFLSWSSPVPYPVALHSHTASWLTWCLTFFYENVTEHLLNAECIELIHLCWDCNRIERSRKCTATKIISCKPTSSRLGCLQVGSRLALSLLGAVFHFFPPPPPL